MDTSMLSTFFANYEWQLALYALIGSVAIPLTVKYLLMLVPAFKEVSELNKEAAAKQVAKSYYNPIQNRSKFWGLLTQLAIFVFILPFCITLESQPWWQILLDVFIILMVYDFFYYMVHRFLFHDGGFGPGPLIWVHSVHHQQKNPCRMDSNYLNPIETCMGLGLYGACIGVLGALMGDFHLVTIIITWIAFSEINQHNHDLMKADRFPFKYLKYMTFMHHVHHARFTAGNYATISLFYDWLFGTYDVGQGWGKGKAEEKGSEV
jgi:sterol desaturase/sphingolipid hydroxylase (fatty acid hydroxylase superfamily)